MSRREGDHRRGSRRAEDGGLQDKKEWSSQQEKKNMLREMELMNPGRKCELTDFSEHSIDTACASARR